MDISPLTDLDEWRRAAAGCQSATFFHTVDWYQAFTAQAQGRLHPLRIVFPDGGRAVFPLLETDAGPGRRHFLSGPGGVYGGWIGACPADNRAARLAEVAVRRYAPNLFWRLNPFEATQAPLAGRGWRADTTQVIDLQAGPAAALHAWSKGHHAAAAQALRHGVTVRRAASSGDWQGYFSCYLASLERWGKTASSRYGWPLFERFASLPSSHVQLWLAEREGRLLAGALVFLHNRHAVYWHGAAHSEGFRFRPVHLLQQEIIRHICTLGIRWYDLNPSGGHHGVEAFKRGFGGQRLPAPYLDQRTRRSLRQLAAAATRRLLAGVRSRP